MLFFQSALVKKVALSSVSSLFLDWGGLVSDGSVFSSNIINPDWFFFLLPALCVWGEAGCWSLYLLRDAAGLLSGSFGVFFKTNLKKKKEEEECSLIQHQQQMFNYKVSTLYLKSQVWL